MEAELLLPTPTSPQARKGQALPVLGDRCFDVWSLDRLKRQIVYTAEVAASPVSPTSAARSQCTRVTSIPQQLSPVWHAGKEAVVPSPGQGNCAEKR